MGSVFGRPSTPPGDESGAGSRRKGTQITRSTSVYAEIVSDQGLPADLPPIKVLINDQLASTAVDQLRDSQVAAHDLAKTLVVDMLTDQQSPAKLGIMLKHIFSYESLLLPTRELIYWSLQLPSTYEPIRSQSTAAVGCLDKHSAAQRLATVSESWLLHPATRTQVLAPLLTWTCAQQDLAVQPLTALAKDSIPPYKEDIKAAMKDNLLWYLRSAEARQVVRDGVLGYLVSRQQQQREQSTGMGRGNERGNEQIEDEEEEVEG